MFSYIFMKILESRPTRYDKGINLFTGGHASRVKITIVDRWVQPGMEVLDVGCGTGELLEGAVNVGAHATGIDISEGMLSMAKKRFSSGNLEGKAQLHHAGVTELDNLFHGKLFDLVTSTLVFSELFAQKRTWAYKEIARVLSDQGILVLAGEVHPKGFFKRLIHLLIRLPLAILTYLVAQTGTKAVPDMAGELSRAGFEVLGEERSFLGSFSIVWARKTPMAEKGMDETENVIKPEDDASHAQSVWDWIGRWFPSPAEPGLRKIGSPGKDSPVYVTGNFHLTVRRVEKALSSMDAWLLVAPTNGINVWCAACGGEMTTKSVVIVIKTSGISERVSHRRLVLPQFAAPGVNMKKLKEETGWKASFGPAYIEDIADYIENSETKTQPMCIAKYPLGFRLEMLVCMNVLLWTVISWGLLFFNAPWAAWFSLIFWGAGIVLYAGYPYLPGNSGWLKGQIMAVLIVFIIGWTSDPWYGHWGWMLWAVFICFWLGFDLRGIVEGSPSEASNLLERLGAHSVGKFYSVAKKPGKELKHNISLCSHCRTCMGVCPKGVFGLEENRKRVTLLNLDDCFFCSACVVQCPEKALILI